MPLRGTTLSADCARQLASRKGNFFFLSLCVYIFFFLLFVATPLQRRTNVLIALSNAQAREALLEFCRFSLSMGGVVVVYSVILYTLMPARPALPYLLGADALMPLLMALTRARRRWVFSIFDCACTARGNGERERDRKLDSLSLWCIRDS